jgi:hypothetical protein
MRAFHCRALMLLSVLLLGGMAGGCSHDLFTDENRTQRTLRYYDNDSATQTTEARRQSTGSPFGMPGGAAAQ